ncbi:MAG: hypothetical protein JRI73_02835 [Deltaproteobacteria bacterium]|nr:hypothetical protein [Deltaproteobacteria bacterium]
MILDEAHYLSDPDRGVVWEEVLIYLPPRVRLLLLSRGSSNRVVKSEERPVPLETLFLFPDGLIASLGTRKGLNPKVKGFLGSKRGRPGRGRHESIDFGKVIKCLRELERPF